MPDITTESGVRLHYSETRQGDPIVLIHGLSFVGAAWAPIVDRLAGKYRVFTMDNRRVGQTPEGSFDIPDMAGDVAALLVIDPDGIIRAMVWYPMSTGRSVPKSFASSGHCRHRTGKPRGRRRAGSPATTCSSPPSPALEAADNEAARDVDALDSYYRPRKS